LIKAAYVHPVPHELGADLQIWQLDLDAYAATAQLDELSAHEHARAARMAFGQDAQRYLACRHALRRILADALECSVQSVKIEIDELDKPRLADHVTLQFNVSHSAQVGLIALSRDTPIGVDIEVVRSIIDTDTLARSHFTDDELAEWLRMAKPERDRSFLTCWTRKEACLKALGVGLSAPPSAVNAGCSPRVRVVSVSLGERRCALTVYPLVVPCGTVAAVAIAEPEEVTLARQFFQGS